MLQRLFFFLDAKSMKTISAIPPYIRPPFHESDLNSVALEKLLAVPRALKRLTLHYPIVVDQIESFPCSLREYVDAMRPQARSLEWLTLTHTSIKMTMG